MSRSLLRLSALSAAVIAALVVAPLAAAAPPTTPTPPTYTSFPAVTDPGKSAPGYFSPYWFDDTGTHIQAHGGQVVTVEENGAPAYYWYGEDRSNGYYDSPGVAVYRSTDALNWTNEGVAMRSVTDKSQLTDASFDALYDTVDDSGAVDQERVDELFFHLNVENTKADGTTQLNAIFERPKVLYNESTGKWVMWWHSDGSITPGGSNYARSLAAVAVSDSPTGPFTLTGAFRLYNEPTYKTACNQSGAVPGGARDMTVFQDEDGTAYVSYSSEENRTLYIAKLNSEYTNVEKTTTEDPVGFQFSDDGTFPRIFADGTAGAPVDGEDYTIVKRCGVLEAPAIFTHDGRYNLVASGATGWDPNSGTYYTASDILGDWTRGVETDDRYENVAYNSIPEGGDGRFAVGDTRNTTFGSQPTHVLPLDASEGKYVYMGDRWNAGAADSTYVWMPIVIGENGRLEMRNPAIEDARWANGWTEEYWDSHGAGAYLWSVVDDRLPASVRANTDLAGVLPATVTTRANGVDRETAVTWNRTTFAATGPQTLTGTLAADADFTAGRTFTRTVDVEAYGAVNIAPQATVTASSRQDLARTVIDGSAGKGWDDWVSGGNYPRNSSLAFRWAEPRVLQSVTVRTYKDGSTATWPSTVGVSYRDGSGAWVRSSVSTAVAQNASAAAPVVQLDVSSLPPTSELRVDLSTATSTWQSVAEVEITGYAPNSETVLTGLSVDGRALEGFSPTVSEYTVGKTSAAVPTVTASAAAGRTVDVVQPTAERPWAWVTVRSVENDRTVAARAYRLSFVETSGSCPAVRTPWRSTAFGPTAPTFCDDGSGAFRITDANTGAWTNKDNLSVVSQPDRMGVGVSIETQVTALAGGSNTDARAGLVVRNDLSAAAKGSSRGYALLTTSPTGAYLQSDATGDGFIDTQSATLAAGAAPVQLKLERTTATTVTGYARASATDAWTTVGTATLASPDAQLDGGVYAGANNAAGPATATFAGTRFSTDVVPVSFTATTSSRCIAQKAVLTVTAKNTGSTPATFTLTTAYGTATLTDVAPGAHATRAFSTRLASLPAGSADVSAKDAATTAAQAVPYSALACR